MKNYDVIIIGGGPAGSTAGYLLSKFGLRVLLLDKSRFPRDKLCGGCVTQKTISLVKRVFGESVDQLREKGIIDSESNRYGIFCRNTTISVKDTHATLYFVQRYLYDHFLLKKAQEIGAEVLENEAVARYDATSHQVVTVSEKTFTGKFIIGADGVNSVVRRHFPDDQFDRATWRDGLGTALEVMIDRTVIPDRINHPALYFDYINYGYAWLFPNKEKMVAGIGGLSHRNKKKLLLSLQTFLSSIGIPDHKEYQPKGYAFPYGNFLLRPVYKNILLTGDAAGFADPLLGEGIYYAQRSAELAALAISGSVKESGSRYEQEKLIAKRYEQSLQEDIYQEFEYAKKIRHFMFTYFCKLHYLPLKIMMSLLGTKPIETIHGLRSYKWMKRKV